MYRFANKFGVCGLRQAAEITLYICRCVVLIAELLYRVGHAVCSESFLHALPVCGLKSDLPVASDLIHGDGCLCVPVLRNGRVTVQKNNISSHYSTRPRLNGGGESWIRYSITKLCLFMNSYATNYLSSSILAISPPFFTNWSVTRNIR